VEVIKGTDDFSSIKADYSRGENVVVLAVAEDIKVTTRTKGDSPCKEFLSFNGGNEVREKWVGCFWGG
jgi:hypothetical protein